MIIISKPIIIAICGKSASGKDSLASMLKTYLWASCGLNTKSIVSCTTRPARVNEWDGQDYYFINTAEFLEYAQKKEFLEYTDFKGWHYGTLKTEVSNDSINIGVFNPEGLLKLSKYKNDYTIIPIFINAGFLVRIKRSIKREGKWSAEYIRRAIVDRKDFIRINDYLNMFKFYLKLPRGLSTYEEAKKIRRYLEKINVI